MPKESVTYSVILLVMTVGVAALLAGEYFHGIGYLVWVGGAVALVAVGGLTLAIGQASH